MAWTKATFLTILVIAVTFGFTYATSDEKRQVDPPTNLVQYAFSAGLTQMVNVSANVTIKYDRVWLNVGGGYDNTTGIFTAPYGGTYMFIFHGLAEYDGFMWLDLYKNNQYLITAYAHVTGQYGAASNALVVSVKKGDTIYVRGHGTSILYGYTDEVYSTFSGYLMFV